MSERITLDKLAGGAVLEMFEDALQQALDNVVDPNTKATFVREVKITLKIKPYEDRELAQVTILPAVKLAPPMEYPTQFFLGRTVGGEAHATEYNPQQLHTRSLLEQGEQTDNVVPMNREKGAESE